MNETGIYSVDELREITMKSIEDDYHKEILEVMAACRYVAYTLGFTEAFACFENECVIKPVATYFTLKGFKVKQVKETELSISWE